MSTLALLTLAASLLSSSTVVAAPQHGLSVSAQPQQIVRSRIPQRGYMSKAAREFHKRSNAAQKSKKRSVVPLIDNAPTGYDVEYLVQVKVGTPPQNLTACLFDTGSDILYVPYQCSTEDCLDHPEYDPAASSTSKDLGQSVTITYGSGTAAGTAYSDTVSISNYTVANQQFVAANDITSGEDETDVQQAQATGTPSSGNGGFGGGGNGGFGPSSPGGTGTTSTTTLPVDPSDCLIGISYATIPETGTLDAPNFMQNLVSAGTLSSFGMYLVTALDVSGASTSGNASQNFVSGSELCFGCTDTSKYTGTFASTAVAQPTLGYWAGEIDGLTINGQLIANSGTNMLFDSGTTLAGLPTTTLASIASALGATASQEVTDEVGGTGYAISCDATLPATVGVQVAGQNFLISAQDLVLPITTNLCALALFGYDASESEGIGGILGQTFLKNVYSNFSYANGGSISFANLTTNASSTASSVTSADAATTSKKSIAADLATPRHFGMLLFAVIALFVRL